MHNQTVDILMATYNGAKFIRTQILSLMGQSFQSWNLLIHDDGSTDATTDIIREMMMQDSRIRLIEDDKKGLGPGRNFMHLLKYSTAPFACFCDQDDLWFENKLEVMFETINQKENSRPQVVFFNAYTWIPDKNNTIRPNYVHYTPKSLKDALFINGGQQGAGSIFNAIMRQMIDKPYQNLLMHDHVLTMAGIISDGLDVLDIPLMLYRHHAANFTAPISEKGWIKLTQTLINRRQIPVIQWKAFYGNAEIYRIFGSEMTATQRKYFELYLSYPSMNATKRFFSILRHGFTKRCNRLLLITKMMMRPYIN